MKFAKQHAIYFTGILATIFCVKISVALEITQQCVPKPANLVSWWTGDTDARDAKGGNHGTMLNGTTVSRGFVTSGTGKAFLFPADTNAYISIGNPKSLFFKRDLTFIAWLYPTTSNGVDHIFTRRSPGCSTLDYQIQRNGNQLTASTGVLSEIFSGLVIPTNQFSFVAVVFNNATPSKTLNFYVNNNSKLGVPANGTVGLLPDADVQIGQANGCDPNNHFDGRIDEVAIFSRALTSAEIRSIYKARRSGMCKPNTP